MKKFLYFLLKKCSVMALKKYRPKIIGITGSVGKSGTKEAVYAVASSRFSARRNLRNYNNEIGLPLSIFGLESPGKNILGWFSVFLNIFKTIAFKNKFPEILVLEFGADRPGDISYLTSFIKPNIGIVTSVGQIPVHVEYYAGPLEVAKEKQKLIEALDVSDCAILNYDDDTVFNMKFKTKAEVLTFGFGDNADIRAKKTEYFGPDWKSQNKLSGTRLEISIKGKIIETELINIFGKPKIYSALAAIGAGMALDISLDAIIGALHRIQPLAGRLNILKGIKGSLIIDDSYNAAPQSTHAALDVLQELEAKRKIAVLGDMRELGKYSFEAHEAIGDKAAEFVDILFAIGDKGKIIAEHAKTRGMNEKNVFWFDLGELDLKNAGKKLQELIEPGDMILVKGSQSMRLEKIVEEIMNEPERAGILLVRQDKSWKAKPVL